MRNAQSAPLCFPSVLEVSVTPQALTAPAPETAWAIVHITLPGRPCQIGPNQICLACCLRAAGRLSCLGHLVNVKQTLAGESRENFEPRPPGANAIRRAAGKVPPCASATETKSPRVTPPSGELWGMGDRAPPPPRSQNLPRLLRLDPPPMPRASLRLDLGSTMAWSRAPGCGIPRR
jgi:hypothetical protein